MYILIDYRIPEEAKNKLAEYGKLLELKSNNNTYYAISSHPDIFCCQTPDHLIIAPNISSEIINVFDNLNIKYILGNKPIGKKYPQSSFYNAVITDKLLIHNTKNTDDSIINYCSGKKIISVNQGYTRCNLIVLNENNFITSDKGINKKLQFDNRFNVMFVNPDNILLTGAKNGFFGGCCGVYKNKLFIIGNLNSLSEKNDIKNIVTSSGIEIIEVYNGPLYDGGGIFFIET